MQVDEQVKRLNPEHANSDMENVDVDKDDLEQSSNEDESRTKELCNQMNQWM